MGTVLGMKIVTVVGARPQFVKAGIVSKAISDFENLEEILVHTGQHFDANMSDVFFKDLGIPAPKYILDINGGSHGEMTGRMLIALEEIFVQEKPDMVMVYGDTNSTLAGALAAAKMHIPVCHVEAGLRSFNMKMPEEINRILTDRVSSILFCPTDAAVENLVAEGFDKSSKNVQILQVGDVMYDAAITFKDNAQKPDADLPDNFIVATFHRAENTDDADALRGIVDALNSVHSDIMPVVLPLHPRTKNAIEREGLSLDVITLPPVGYTEMLWLLNHCSAVMTDSGGLQKEAFFFRKPCVTMREQTEWVELALQGYNIVAGSDTNTIVQAVRDSLAKEIPDNVNLYGGGSASQKIASTLSAMA